MYVCMLVPFCLGCKALIVVKYGLQSQLNFLFQFLKLFSFAPKYIALCFLALGFPTYKEVVSSGQVGSWVTIQHSQAGWVQSLWNLKLVSFQGHSLEGQSSFSLRQAQGLGRRQVKLKASAICFISFMLTLPLFTELCFQN